MVDVHNGFGHTLEFVGAVLKFNDYLFYLLFVFFHSHISSSHQELKRNTSLSKSYVAASSTQPEQAVLYVWKFINCFSGTHTGCVAMSLITQYGCDITDDRRSLKFFRYGMT